MRLDDPDRWSRKYSNMRKYERRMNDFLMTNAKHQWSYIYLSHIFVQSLIFADCSKTMVLEEQLSKELGGCINL